MSLFGGKHDDDLTPNDRVLAGAAARRQPTPNPQLTGGRNSDVANIGKSIAIKGDLSGEEDLVIEGKVEGRVELLNNQLTVGANGVVQAEVSAKSVVVVGHVAGNVNGTERIEIQATGIVEGDVTAPRLVVAEGAVVNGSIHMTKKPGASAAPAPNQDVRKTA